MNHDGPRRPPIFLIAMAVLAIVSLALGVINQVGQQAIQSQRNDDRIQSDLAACARGNVVRAQIKDGFAGVDEAVVGILDAFFGAARPDQSERVAELRAQLVAPLAKLDKASAAIAIVDCKKAVPGAIPEK